MGSRGVAPVVGISLLIGFVLVGALGVLAVGSVAVDSIQSDAKVEQAERSMVEYADAVRNGQSTSLSVPESGRTAVSDESTIRIEVGSDEVVNTTLGAVVYRQGGSERAFEGGAVFSGSGDGTRVVSAPPISYEEVRSEQSQSLTIDVVTVGGSVDDLETASVLEQSSVDTNTTTNPIDESVTVTIQSEYAAGWANYFREQTQASIDHDRSTNTVTATFPVVDPVAVDNSFTVDGSIGMGGGVSIASYDSRTAQDAGTVGDGNYVELQNGDVVATGGFTGTGSGSVDGDLYIDSDFSFDGGTVIAGDIYATGNITIGTSTPLNRTIVAGGDIILNNGGVNFESGAEVRAAGDLRLNDGAQFAGTFHVGGEMAGPATWSNYDSSTELIAGETVNLPGNPDPSMITENADAPSTSELSRIQEAIASMPNAADRVQRAQERFSSAPTIPLGGNGAIDEVDAGNYQLTGDLTYGGSPSLTFDTSDGDVNLLVQGDVDAPNLDAEVLGDGQVNIYVTGNFETSGSAQWTNPDGAGNRLFVYTAATSETTRLRAEDFYGALFSESDAELRGDTRVYGAIVMNGSEVHGGQDIYFDEALAGMDLNMDDGSESNAQRTYLHVTQTTVGDD